jgi:hypothetical protein
VAARLPSAIFGSAFVVATAWLGHTLGGRRAAVLAGLLALLHPLALWYSQEARAYALSMLLATTMIAATVDYLRRGGVARLALVTLATVLAELSHFAAILGVAMAAVLVLAWGAPMARALAGLAGLWISAIPVLFTREAYDYFYRLGVRIEDFRAGKTATPGLDVAPLAEFVAALPYPAVRTLGGPSILLEPLLGQALVGLSIAIGGLILVFGNRGARVLLAGFVLACTLAWLFPQTRILISDRYLTITLGPLLAAAATALVRVRPRPAAIAVLGLTLALLLAADGLYWFDSRVGKGPDYRQPAQYLAAHAAPADVLIEADVDRTFAYYVEEVFGASVREVHPRTGNEGASVEEIGSELAAALRGARLVWYMPRWTESYVDSRGDVRRWLETNLCVDQKVTFDVVDLYAFSDCRGVTR